MPPRQPPGRDVGTPSTQANNILQRSELPVNTVPGTNKPLAHLRQADTCRDEKQTDEKWRLTRNLQLWCLPPQAGEEDRNLSARPLHLHLLRQGHRQASLHWHLGLQVLQEDCRRWCLHPLVRRTRPLPLPVIRPLAGPQSFDISTNIHPQYPRCRRHQVYHASSA